MGASRRGFSARLAEEAALARGYAAIVEPSYRSQRGEPAAAELERALDGLERAAVLGATAAVEAAVDDVEALLEGFRAAPLDPAEQARRAGQLDRFLRLVPIEYDRGVEGTRVTLAFEIQEAISFRDAVAAALADISPELLARDPAATRELTAIVAALGVTLDAAGAGRAAPAETVRARTDRALELIDDLYPDSWKEAASGADFDVIAASLDRLAAAAKVGNWGRAEQARLEAYGIFELGPEQRLRGIAPSLFRRIEGLFWYGDGGQAGLVQLVKRKDAGPELEESVAALQTELEQAAQRVGSSGSTTAIVSNSAIVVFREGLEAVLILAALMASMVGPARRYRRPLLVGAGFALVASAITWVIAQTVLGSLARYGEKLEAIVSVIAIGVLLLILNWFYHRVYWAEHLADFHKRKQRILRGSHVGFISAQVLGLALLGFSSVYREGFETRPLPPGADARGRHPRGPARRHARPRRHAGRRRPDDHARAQAPAPEDADRDRDPDDVGARDPRRHDRADVPGRRLAARDADRGRTAALLGRRLARRSTRPGRASPRRWEPPSSSSAATSPPSRCGHGSGGGSSRPVPVTAAPAVRRPDREPELVGSKASAR